MNYKKLGFGLGVFSIGLGLVELFGARRAARTLGVEGGRAEGVIRLFGAREILAGGCCCAVQQSRPTRGTA